MRRGLSPILSPSLKFCLFYLFLEVSHFSYQVHNYNFHCFVFVSYHHFYVLFYNETGGHELSKTTGNAGARVACGNTSAIQIVSGYEFQLITYDLLFQ